MASDTLKGALFNYAFICIATTCYFGSIIMCFCCELDRKVPINYAILSVFTISISYLVSLICCRYPPQIVFIAAFLTCAMVICLTVYAFTTKNDLTLCGPIFYLLPVLFICSILMSIFMGGMWRHTFSAMFGVILFSFFIIYDLQVIIKGGRYADKMDVDRYILAAMILYLDIINLFLEILKLVGGD